MSERLTIVHSSDVHVDDEYTARSHGGDGAAGLAAVLATARAAGADVLLLAGDTFERNALPEALSRRAAALIAEAALPVVILPGNHDPALPGSPHHIVAAHAKNAAVLGVTHEREVTIAGLTVTGVPHLDYADARVVDRLAEKASRWRILMAHGHFEPAPLPDRRFSPSWLIGPDDLAQEGLDYVALGHWNRHAEVAAVPPAHYSGSPDFAGTVNRVTLAADAPAQVERLPIPGFRRG